MSEGDPTPLEGESRRPAPRRRRPARRPAEQVENPPLEPAAQLEAGAETASPPARRRRRPPARRRPADEGDEAPNEAIAAPLDEPATDSVEDSDEGDDVPVPDGEIVVDITIPRGWARRVSAKLIRTVVLKALEMETWQGGATLDVLMVSDADMQDINATRRGIDEATDVLSFPMMDLQPGAIVTQDYFLLPPESSPHLGDVVISMERVGEQAREAGHSEERELAYLTVHGVLHILGYDHENDRDRRVMRRREEEILGALGIRRPEPES